MSRKLRLACLSILTIAIALLTIYFFESISILSESSGRVPEVVENLLSDYTEQCVIPASLHSFPFEDYIQGAEVQQEDMHASMTLETSTFFRILGEYNFGVAHYEIERVSDGFCILRYYDADGELLPAPIGFWWELNASGTKILKWRIARLQPFSTLDPEYAEVWE